MADNDSHLLDENVYRLYVKQVRIVAYSVLKNDADAEDVAQDVFLSFFRIKEPRKIRDMRSYLLRMARNKALELLRQKQKEELTDDFSYYAENCADENEEFLLARVSEEIIRLPLKERQIILMRVKAKMSFAEISRVMDMSISGVYKNYRKALKILQKALKGYR